MDLYEKTLSEESIFKCSFMELVKQKVKLPDGNEAERDIVKHSNGVCVIAFNEKGNILMVEQFRKPFNRVFLELPAGKVDKEEILEKAVKNKGIDNIFKLNRIHFPQLSLQTYYL